MKMARTAIAFTPKYYAHNTGPGHPETPRRLKVILGELERLDMASLAEKCKLVSPHPASLKDLELVHTREHIELVKRVCEHGGGLLDLGDTVVSSKSYEVSRYAVGGVLDAVNLVLRKKFRNAFALVRPPGHHAGPYYAAGFCLFNNVAVAAVHLLRRCGFDRVSIIDIDAHHGNGTQEIFYNTNKVLYVSLHEDPFDFPGTGFIDEVGEGEGLGYNVNIPFPFRVGNKGYLKAINEIVIPIVRQYAPQFILVSAGYDGHFSDPVAKLSLSAVAYASFFEKILDLTSTLCEHRLVAVLEGGYNLKFLGGLVALSISKMAEFSYPVGSGTPPLRLRVEKQAEKAIKEVKDVQSAFWDLPL
jgi:acetoin utilization deacetylase AcuC-like enzyme